MGGSRSTSGSGCRGGDSLAGASEPSGAAGATSSGCTSGDESAIVSSTLTVADSSVFVADNLSCTGGVVPLLLGEGKRSNGSGSVDTISPLLEFSTETKLVLKLFAD